MRRLKQWLPLGLAVAAAAMLPAASTGANTHIAAAKSCSASRLHFRYKKGLVTYSDKVEKLTVIGATCSSAGSLATTVAKDLLYRKKVPSQVGAWHPHVKNPCKGCSPVWKVTAYGGGAKATFEVHGGAY